MPLKPRKICKSNRCNNLAEMGKSCCLKHQRWQERRTRQVNVERVMFNKLANSRQWRNVRITWLQEHPLCEECLKHGTYIKAEEVDHIKPHKGNMFMFWDSTNWQSLCKSCHSSKTMKENRERKGE